MGRKGAMEPSHRPEETRRPFEELGSPSESAKERKLQKWQSMYKAAEAFIERYDERYKLNPSYFGNEAAHQTEIFHQLSQNHTSIPHLQFAGLPILESMSPKLAEEQFKRCGMQLR